MRWMIFAKSPERLRANPNGCASRVVAQLRPPPGPIFSRDLFVHDLRQVVRFLWGLDHKIQPHANLRSRPDHSRIDLQHGACDGDAKPRLGADHQDGRFPGNSRRG